MTHLTTEAETRTVVVKRPWASFSSWMATASTHLGTWSIATLAFMTGAIEPLQFGDSSLFFKILGVVVLLILVAVLLTKSELFGFRMEERVVTIPPPRRAMFEEDAPHPADEQLASREEEIQPVAAPVAGAPESGLKPDNGRRNGHKDGSSPAPRDTDVSSATPRDGQSEVATGDKTRTA